MQLTNSEKKLLYILALVATLVVCVRFILMPTFEKHEELKLQLESTKQQEADIQMKLAAGAGIDERIEEKVVASEELVKPYFRVMEKEYLQRWMMDMARKAQVEVTSLTISDPQVTQVGRYSVSKGNTSYPIGSLYHSMINATEEATAEEATEAPLPYANAEGTDQVICHTFNVNIKASQANLLTFVDNLSALEQHVIVQNLPLPAYNEGLEKEASLTVSVYSIDKENDGLFDQYEF